MWVRGRQGSMIGGSVGRGPGWSGSASSLRGTMTTDPTNGPILAFSAYQAVRLTRPSLRQLSYLDSTEFFSPEYAPGYQRGAFSRVYSFRDVVEMVYSGPAAEPLAFVPCGRGEQASPKPSEPRYGSSRCPKVPRWRVRTGLVRLSDRTFHNSKSSRRRPTP